MFTVNRADIRSAVQRFAEKQKLPIVVSNDGPGLGDVFVIQHGTDFPQRFPYSLDGVCHAVSWIKDIAKDAAWEAAKAVTEAATSSTTAGVDEVLSRLIETLKEAL